MRRHLKWAALLVGLMGIAASSSTAPMAGASTAPSATPTNTALPRPTPTPTFTPSPGSTPLPPQPTPTPPRPTPPPPPTPSPSPAPVTISINDISVVEGDEGLNQVVFTISLSRPIDQPVFVSAQTADGDFNTTGYGSATQGEDYQASFARLYFPAGATTAKFYAIVNADLDFPTRSNLNDVDEAFVVNLRDPQGAPIADGQGVCVIRNDDSAPFFVASDISVREGSAGSPGAATFTVSVPNGFVSPNVFPSYQVDIATSDSTADAGIDYRALTTQTLTFAEGQTSQQVTVPLIGDGVQERDETFNLILFNARDTTGYYSQVNIKYGAGQHGLATIVDDDAPAQSLSINDVSKAEGDAGTTPFTFTVSLSQAATAPVSVQVQTQDGDSGIFDSAFAPGDYQAVGPLTLTFSPGQTSKTVTVLVNGDTTAPTRQDSGRGGTRSFFVNLSNAKNATIADGQGRGTLLDDDSDAPAFSISDARVVEGNSGSKTLWVFAYLSNFETFRNGVDVQPKFSVDVTTSNGTATSGSDYTPVTTTLSAVGSGSGWTFFIEVPIIGDTTPEGDETFFVTLSNPRSDTEGFTPRIVGGKATVTIQNDDTASNPNPIILDNLDGPSRVTIVGDWESSLYAPAYYGVNYLTDKNTGKGAKSVKFTPNLPRAGRYAVYGRWTSGANRASNVPFVFTHAAGTTRVSVNQRINGGVFILLGIFQFNAGTSGSVSISNAGTNGFVIADAVKFTPLDDAVGVLPITTRAVVANTLSTGTVSVAGNSVTLNFSRALQAGTETGFRVRVNGQATEVLGAQIKGGKVTLMLDGDLKTGDQVVVSWPDGTTALVAR